MKDELFGISDEQFIAQFEDKTLDPAYFSHQGHLRAAWLYLRRYDRQGQVNVDEASRAISRDLHAFALSLGAIDKFHVTITESMMQLMASRYRDSHAKNWQEFLKENPDLLEDTIVLLSRYYSKERLLSDEARVSLIRPDLMAIT